MAWTDETEEGAAEGAGNAQRSRRLHYCGGDGGASDTARTADGDHRREALHGTQMVLEAVAGGAARSDAQE
jgi:hypothetical protein